MSAPIDIRGILERAGADPDAPKGSQAWALAQVDAAVAELIEASAELADDQVYTDLDSPDYEPETTEAAIARNRGQRAYWRVLAALARVGGQP